MLDKLGKFFENRRNEGNYNLFLTPQRCIHELLPKALVRILFIELLLDEREPAFGDVVEHCFNKRR